MKIRHINPKALFSVLLALAMGISFSAKASDAGEHEHHGKGNRWGIALFLGGTEAHSEWEATAGIELEYLIDDKWSVAALWEQTDGEDDPTLWMGLVGFRPYHKVGLQAGIGTHEVGEHSETAYRLAIDYEFLLSPTWFLKPYAAYDFIENSENEPVLGVYIGKLF